ncbi:chitinase [Streptomyces sp. NPDC002506]|uniref:chitinase n=1 Tax=Streptomyces sp. NPDC002506 TaxID=3154536 RepID=UPI00332D11FB
MNLKSRKSKIVACTAIVAAIGGSAIAATAGASPAPPTATSKAASHPGKATVYGMAGVKAAAGTGLKAAIGTIQDWSTSGQLELNLENPGSADVKSGWTATLTFPKAVSVESPQIWGDFWNLKAEVVKAPKNSDHGDQVKISSKDPSGKAENETIAKGGKKKLTLGFSYKFDTSTIPAVKADAAVRGIQSWSPYVDPTMGQSNGTITWGKETFSIADYMHEKVPGTKNVTLAFITVDTQGKPAWAGQPTLSTDKKTYIDVVNGIRQRGGDVTFSFGGANGAMIDEKQSDPDKLAEMYKKIIKDYDLTKLDFDVEGAHEQQTQVNGVRAKALAKVQAWAKQQGRQLHISYTLAVLDSHGLNDSGVAVVDQAKKAGVNVDQVNIMTMDYGGDRSDMAKAAEDATDKTAAQLAKVYGKSASDMYKMIGVTPMIGVNDVPNETFKAGDAPKLRDWAKSKGVGMLSMWSANRDQPGSKNELYNHSGLLDQQPGEFSKAFAQYQGK